MLDAEVAQATEMERRARAVADIIATLAKKGLMSSDMSQMYLAYADFRDIRFPHATSFVRSELKGANFTRAHLEGSIFRDAGLAATRFNNAALIGADFSRTSWWIDDSPVEYLKLPQGKLEDLPEEGVMYGPSFDCADLDSSKFDNHAIASVATNAGPRVFLSTSFRGASLRGTDFRRAAVVVVATGNAEVEWLATGGPLSFRSPRIYFAPHSEVSDPPSAQSMLEYSESLRRSTFAFGGSSWETARMSHLMQIVFHNYSPKKRGPTDPCAPRATQNAA